MEAKIQGDHAQLFCGPKFGRGTCPMAPRSYAHALRICSPLGSDSCCTDTSAPPLFLLGLTLALTIVLVIIRSGLVNRDEKSFIDQAVHWSAVLIRNDGRLHCGATFISFRHLITSGECIRLGFLASVFSPPPLRFCLTKKHDASDPLSG